MLAGVATIPLTAVLARKITSTRVSLIALTFVAFNPYLIMYSGIIRSYSIVAALSLLVLILFFRWFLDRSLKNGVYVSIACFFLILSHPEGVYMLPYIGLIAGLDWIYKLKNNESECREI